MLTAASARELELHGSWAALPSAPIKGHHLSPPTPAHTLSWSLKIPPQGTCHTINTAEGD